MMFWTSFKMSQTWQLVVQGTMAARAGKIKIAPSKIIKKNLADFIILPLF
jgi:hypothetical protein